MASAVMRAYKITGVWGQRAKPPEAESLLAFGAPTESAIFAAVLTVSDKLCICDVKLN